MADQLNGLRFDIYERVYLSDEVAAIEELEEIELVPHMQALTQEDQVMLRGHLLLSGIYRSQGASDILQLEHWIPVEISLPLNRIQNVEELAVEIDNFDVDLLSNRSLNVTGVLALRGLQVQAPQEPIWRDDSFTVVHQAEPEQVEFIRDEEDIIIENSEVDEPEGLDDWSLQADNEELPVEATKESSWLSMFQNLEESRKDPEVELSGDAEGVGTEGAVGEGAVGEGAVGEGAVGEGAVGAEGQAALIKSQWGDLLSKREPEALPIDQSTENLPIREEMLEDVLVESVEDSVDEEVEKVVNEATEAIREEYLEEALLDKQDLKVALGGKPLDTTTQMQQSGVGLLSQLGEKGAKREADLKLQAAAQEEEMKLATTQSTASTGDELEWTRLFLNNGGEAHSFRKVKICIVQREETLELIANRYNVLTRELQLYNRLNDPYLSEGQVIYIP